MCLCHQLLVSDVTQSNHTPPTALNKYFWTYQNFAKISPMFIYFSAFAVTKKNWGTSIGQHLTFCNYFFDFRTNQLFVDLKAKCIHYLQQSTVKNILISWWGGGLGTCWRSYFGAQIPSSNLNKFVGNVTSVRFKNWRYCKWMFLNNLKDQKLGWVWSML